MKHKRKIAEKPRRRIYDYKKSSKIRGYVWGLTDEQAKELFTMTCNYCGGEGGGIDRVDNSIGYIPDNCVPCCGTCNKMKLTLGVEEFLAHVRRIVNHQATVQFFMKYERLSSRAG